jgi:flavin-dependent dehydrogenase
VITAGGNRTDALLAAIATVAPGLGDRLQDGRVVASARGIVAPPSHVRDAYGPGWALVGDAGYHRDPMTGHGITDAFRDAELLARAVHQKLSGERDETSALSGYAFARNKSIGEIFGLTKALTAFPGVPRFVELQKRLSDAIEREALTLAAQPHLVPTHTDHPAEVQLMS